MRVLHLPSTVGGLPSGLSRELRAVGIDSYVWTVAGNYLDYPADRVISPRMDQPILPFLRILMASRYVFGRWDIVHFNAGSTLFMALNDTVPKRGIAGLVQRLQNSIVERMSRLELWILRARGIPVFVTYQGDDARQGDYSLANYEISIAQHVPPGYYSPITDDLKRRRVALFERYASKIYAVNPDLLNVLPSSAVFVPYGHVPVAEIVPHFPNLSSARLAIAHAPTNRAVKGTGLFLNALDELAAEGYVFDLDLIEGLPNAEAKERYRRADVVLDQLYAGMYGGFGVEVMAMGKPVVVYLRETDLHYFPEQMRRDLPFFQISPASVKESLRTILEMPRDSINAAGRASRAFVEHWHDPASVTKRIVADYRSALNDVSSRNAQRATRSAHSN